MTDRPVLGETYLGQIYFGGGTVAASTASVQPPVTSPSNTLVVAGVGSADWTGNVAPAGGTHTGTATITMQDGTRFLVASNAAEVLRKLDPHAIAQTAPTWVAFDSPTSPAVSVVLNTSLIASVA